MDQINPEVLRRGAALLAGLARRHAGFHGLPVGKQAQAAPGGQHRAPVEACAAGDEHAALGMAGGANRVGGCGSDIHHSADEVLRPNLEYLEQGVDQGFRQVDMLMGVHLVRFFESWWFGDCQSLRPNPGEPLIQPIGTSYLALFFRY
jgi:hypothetical protein